MGWFGTLLALGKELNALKTCPNCLRLGLKKQLTTLAVNWIFDLTFAPERTQKEI